MDITLSISSAGVFRRVLISATENSRPVDCGLSAIITSPSRKEEIFLPSPEKLSRSVTYPSAGGRFVTQVGSGKYQIIYEPKEKGIYTLKLVGKVHGKPFEKTLQISF